MVENGTHIIRATKDDAQLLSDLSNVTFIETFRGTCSDDDLIGFIDKCFNENVIASELNDADDLYYIAFVEGFPAGYIRLKENYEDYPAIKKYRALELKRIYVLKEFHGKKIGAALMQFAIEVAKQNQYEVLWLGVWEHNHTAYSFYKKWGFVDTGDTHLFPIGNTPQTDNWLMKFIEKH
jgi:GNAT superfamily N-acetyltransferase